MLAGNGVLRRGAAPELRAFARGLHVPVAVTFMGKGAVDDRSHLSLMAVGLQARDHVLSGFDRADLVVSVGYDPVEYAPSWWNPERTKRIIHIDTTAGRGRCRVPARGRAHRRHRRDARSGCWPRSCRTASAAATPASGTRRARSSSTPTCGPALLAELGAYEADQGYPIKPQRAIADLRRALGPSDIVVSDVGAHKVWVARLYQAYEPNTVIISNGFAAMGISLPGAIAAKLVHPERQGRRPVRRRRLPDEQPGARDGQADRRQRHGRRSGATTATG